MFIFLPNPFKFIDLNFNGSTYLREKQFNIWESESLDLIKIKQKKLKETFFKGNYTSPQSIVIMFSYSLV